MARNAEKAMTTLARWRAAQVQEAGGQRERRPYLASECNDLPQAEKWRLQIVREIAKKVAQIQNGCDKFEVIQSDKVILQDRGRIMADPGEAPPDPATDSLHSTILGSLRSSRPSAGSARGSIPSRVEEKGSNVIQPSAEIAGSVSKLAPSPPPPPPRQPSVEPIPLRSPPRRTSISVASKASSHIKSPRTSVQTKGDDSLANLEPQGQIISDHIEELNKSVKEFANNMDPENNLDKISDMSKKLTDEAKYLRESIKHLSADIARVDGAGKCGKICPIDFPYHLFLLELIVNKIQMKCDCFDMDCNNLVISATFLGKHPIILYDSNQGCVEDFYKINVGKSILFAMTYDKICCIEEFEIVMELTKQPPCSHCVTKIGITRMDYTKEFLTLREELCQKWAKEQPKDDILCTTSTPLHKNQFYLSCGEGENPEAIGVIEVSVRMSFLGKEITTEFSASPKPKGTSFMLKEGNGMTMYSCQKVEMDDEGKILLDEDSLTKRYDPPHRRGAPRARSTRSNSPMSQIASNFSRSPQRNYADQQAGLGEFRIRDLNDEINKLMREKRHWEVQIKSLGGPDHARVGPRMLDQDGREVPGNRGYKYFGAAKDLPGVRELFEQEPPAPPRRTRADLMRDVDADYYGYRDDDDGLLVPLEKLAEKDAIAQAVEEWKKNKEEDQDQDLPEEENIYPEDPDDRRVSDDDEPQVITSHVAVPSQKDIEEALLRKKKQELLERYGCLDVKMEES